MSIESELASIRKAAAPLRLRRWVIQFRRRFVRVQVQENSCRMQRQNANTRPPEKVL